MTIATNDLARIFMFPRGVNDCKSEGVYLACLGVDGLTQDNGEVNKIECPDPFGVGFKEVGVYRGEKGRLTTTLTGRLDINQLSLFRAMFDRDCPVDIHIHWGACTNLDAFNQYSVAWVLKDVYVTSWGTDPVIAMMSGDRNVVNETIDVSAGDFYQVKAALVYSVRSTGLTATQPFAGFTVCGRKACQGDPCPPSEGCDKIYGFTEDHHLVYSTNDGVDWFELLIPVVNQGTDPVDVMCECNNLNLYWGNGVVSTIRRSDVDLLVSGVTTLAASPWLLRTNNINITTRLVRSGLNVDFGGPFLIDTAGSLYRASDKCDPTCGVTQLEDLAAAPVTFNDAHGNDGVFVAVGQTAAGVGTIYSYQPASGFVPVPTMPSVNPFHSVFVKSKNHWIVGGINGEMWCTTDGGFTWTAICYPGFSTAPLPTVTDLCVSNSHVLWMTAGGVAYRSVDGGVTWAYEPNNINALSNIQMRNYGNFNRVACCDQDPNKVWFTGTTLAGLPLAVIGLPG